MEVCILDFVKLFHKNGLLQAQEEESFLLHGLILFPVLAPTWLVQ